MRWFWARAEEGEGNFLVKIFGEELKWKYGEQVSNGNINFSSNWCENHCQWSPQSHSIYRHATENWIWTFENSLFCFQFTSSKLKFLSFEWWKHHSKNKPNILFFVRPTSFGWWIMKIEWYHSIFGRFKQALNLHQII